MTIAGEAIDQLDHARRRIDELKKELAEVRIERDQLKAVMRECAERARDGRAIADMLDRAAGTEG